MTTGIDFIMPNSPVVNFRRFSKKKNQRQSSGMIIGGPAKILSEKAGF
jgi:hypothetical protein